MANEQVEYFKAKFALFKAEVFRLVQNGSGRVTHVLNTLKLQGLDIAGILAIIRGEVNAHENNHNAPHGETLESLGGEPKANFDVRMPFYYPRDAIPISWIPIPDVTITMLNQVVVGTFAMYFYGRTVVVPGASFPLNDVAKQYLRVNIIGQAPNFTSQLELSLLADEGPRTLTFGIISAINGAFVASMEQAVRIGTSAISPHPRGNGIPYSSGSQALPGTTPPEWYS